MDQYPLWPALMCCVLCFTTQSNVLAQIKSCERPSSSDSVRWLEEMARSHEAFFTLERDSGSLYRGSEFIVEEVRSVHVIGYRGDDLLQHISAFPRLEQLSLTECTIVSRDMVLLKDLKRLRSVTLFWVSPLGDREVEQLADLPALESLSVILSPGVKGAFLSAFRKARRLRSLDCDIGWTVDSAKLAAEIPRLRNLRLGYVNRDLHAILDCLATSESIRQLSFEAPLVSAQALEPLLRMPNLRVLDLGNSKVEDDALDLVKRSKSLKRVRMEKGEGVKKGNDTSSPLKNHLGKAGYLSIMSVGFMC